MAGMESGNGGASGLSIPHFLFFGWIMVFDFCDRQEAMEEVEGVELAGFIGNKCDSGGG